MRIGIDASCWQNKRGYGRFAREILKAMIALERNCEYIFFVDSASRSACEFPDGANVRTAPASRSAVLAASSSGHRSLKDMYNMGRAVSLEPLDIIFFPSVYSYFPVFSSTKMIVTIHDVIPEMYPQLVFPNLYAKSLWRMKMWAALRQADLILTVSEYSKQGIIEYLKVEADRILVTCEAADPCFQRRSRNSKFKRIKKKYGLSESDRYFLYVGGIGPHKNLRTLLAAFNILKKRRNSTEQKLVIVGDYANDVFLMDPVIKQIASENGSKTSILFTGYVVDEDLSYLYSGAEALVLPSYSEGFGLPAMEAMSCGTAVIGSATTSLPEIVGEAGLFFDPESEIQLVKCMESIYYKPSLRESLGKAGLRRAKSYTWQYAAVTVLQAMEALVK